ncbi:MAG TPA: MFS transporter [Solirubrobacteraceae bacterium]|nr:MFS transporter [Solirubrobacteraceae bacterium]
MLPKSPRLRRILFAYAVNELGTWFGYVALALGVYDHTHSAIATAGLFVARGLLPALLAPVLVARTERSSRGGRLAWLYLLEAVLTVALAALLWHFWLAGVLVVVTVDGIVAVAATALVRASAARVAVVETRAGASSDLDRGAQQAATEAAQREASAALNFAFMGTLAIGPAIGGALVHAVGGPVALLVDALTFLACAGLLLRLSTHIEEPSGDSIRTRLLAAVQHLRAVPALRVLFVTEAIAIVVFASVEPVEVLYAKSTLGAGDLGFGLLVAAWGVGAALGAVVFARSVRRPLGPMLTGGTLLVGLAYLGFAVSPTLVFACGSAVVGGIGNGIQWPSLISAVQQLTPAALHGRLMSAVGSLNALCPAIGFALGGGIAALSSPRVAMAVAGTVATLATVAFLRLPMRGLRGGVEDQATVVTEPSLVTTTQ